MANDEPTMLYYDAEGQRVDADDPAASRQYLSDDPARPDAEPRTNTVFGAVTSEPAAPIVYYDANGAQVPEGDARAVRQYSADDPARPDAPAGHETMTETISGTTEVTDAPAGGGEQVEPGTQADNTPTPPVKVAAKAQAKPAANKARTSSDNK